MEEVENEEVIEDSNVIDLDEEVSEEPLIVLQEEISDEPVIDYTEQLESILLNLKQLNEYNTEQSLYLEDIYFSLEDERLTEFEATQLLLLETLVAESAGEMVVDENAEHYQTAEFYGNLSIIVILALITIALTWKFVWEVFSSFTRYIG